MSLTVGDSYRTQDTNFLHVHGIPHGVDYVVTNIGGGKVSLFLKFANGKQGPQRLTICKEWFGEHFKLDVLSPTQKAYAHDKHYFPEVNPLSAPVWPSPRYARRSD